MRRSQASSKQQSHQPQGRPSVSAGTQLTNILSYRSHLKRALPTEGFSLRPKKGGRHVFRRLFNELYLLGLGRLQRLRTQHHLHHLRHHGGLAVVTILRFTRDGSPHNHITDVLMRLLERAAYSTADLSAAPGRDYVDEQSTIRRIRTAMIGTSGYPASQRARRNIALELEKWENEGGSLKDAHDKETHAQ